MHVVALPRVEPEDVGSAAELASALGWTNFEAASRLRVPVGAPSVLCSFADANEALACAAAVRRAGFAPLVLDARPHVRRGPPPGGAIRSFVLDDEALVLPDRDSTKRVRYDDVEMLIETTRTRIERVSASSDPDLAKLAAKVFGDERARRPKRRERVVRTLHVVTRHDRTNVDLLERGLNYASLGEALQPARHANFRILVAALRERCRRAAYDDRLTPRMAFRQVLGPTLPPESHHRVAVAILVAASRRQSRDPFRTDPAYADGTSALAVPSS